ncbi:hypothetical protein SAMN05443575_2317 [Jatrophihabitans endophyticus]|uniref:Uncharacterized protein n=1 Tax=Jatrophihabitans endophyticus TaxID=1206085 RepID=A0A1M5L0P5_9ACTN|nr:hypothetical protein [Jatrophihabitans endophyticus]SHG58654.1 hypothetical protein SAMN05443575_2317 [Jatrophihabitans endophyticus]
MSAFALVWGVVLVVAGLALASWGWRRLRTRPGWGGRYGKGSLVTLVGAFVALAGVVDVVLALE